MPESLFVDERALAADWTWAMGEHSYRLVILLVVIVACCPAHADDTVEVSQTSGANEILTVEKCSKGHSGCCSEMYLGDSEGLAKCFAIHSPKLPAPGSAETSKMIKFLSCFVECIYKQKKYIGKNDSINMKMVKLNAEKLYADRSKEKEYYIKIMDTCRKDAAHIYNLLKASPGSTVLLKDTCRPFFMFVYLCQADYHKKHECPYFRWDGNANAGTKEMCATAKAKCYELDGIVPQASFSFM